MSQTVSIVVPVYNNEPTLEETCRQIIAVHESAFSDLELEVIFVNDGSTDNSWEELLRLQRLRKERISVIKLSRRFGQLGALFAGLNSASGDAIICLSADLQDPIDLMAKMVAYWKNNTEIVICYRETRVDGLIARISSYFAYAIARVSYPELPKGGFDYWLMGRKVCDLLLSSKRRGIFLQGHLSSVGFSKAFIPYTRVPRNAGRSGYTFWQKLGLVIDLLIDSYLPIRIMSCLGAITALCGVIYSFLIVYAWLMNSDSVLGLGALDDHHDDNRGNSHGHARYHRRICLAHIRSPEGFSPLHHRNAVNVEARRNSK